MLGTSLKEKYNLFGLIIQFIISFLIIIFFCSKFILSKFLKLNLCEILIIHFKSNIKICFYAS